MADDDATTPRRVDIPPAPEPRRVELDPTPGPGRVTVPSPPAARRVSSPSSPAPRRVDVPSSPAARRVLVPSSPAPRRVQTAPSPGARRVDLGPWTGSARRVDTTTTGTPVRRVDTSGPADLTGEPAGRGQLQIAEKVFERIAAVAAGEVAGVGSPQGNQASQLLGRGLPRASVDVAGSRVHLATAVPLRWPSVAPATASAVREHVGSRVTEMTGRTVDSVDVELAAAVRSGGSVRPGEPVTPTPARVPTGPAAAAVVGIVLSLVLIGAGVVAIRDALIKAGALGGSALLPRAGRWLAGLGPTGLVLGLSIASLVVGLVLLVLALRRRSRPDLSLDAATPVHLGARDVARVAAAAADRVDGVQNAHATATRSKVRVVVKVTGETPEIAEAVTQRVTEALRSVRGRRGTAGPAVTTTMKGI